MTTGIVCGTCGETFARKPTSPKQRYCSRRCSSAAKVKRTAPLCAVGHGPKARRKHQWYCRECDRLRLAERARARGRPTRAQARIAAQSPDVGYRGVHHWLARNFTKSGVCTECQRDVGATGKSGTHWAYLGQPGQWERDREKYVELCPKCHFALDRSKLEAVT